MGSKVPKKSNYKFQKPLGALWELVFTQNFAIFQMFLSALTGEKIAQFRWNQAVGLNSDNFSKALPFRSKKKQKKNIKKKIIFSMFFFIFFITNNNEKKNFVKIKWSTRARKHSRAPRQINDHLRWVSTNRNVRIALSFTTLGSIKVVYNWFESVTLQHMITQLIDAPFEQSKKTMLRHKNIFVSA